MKDKQLPYIAHQSELTLHDGCIHRESRVVIPLSLQATLLRELHDGHHGMVRMKELSRSSFWWPRLDSDIETASRTCSGCQQTQKNPATTSLHPWEWPSQPSQRLHINRRTTQRQHGCHRGRRTKQIPESHSNEVHNFGQDHLKSLRNFRSAPHSGDHCHRQWSTVRIR